MPQHHWEEPGGAAAELVEPAGEYRFRVPRLFPLVFLVETLHALGCSIYF